MRNGWGWAGPGRPAGIVLVAAVCLLAPAAALGEVTPAALDGKIQQLAQDIRAEQKDDGSFGGGRFTIGETSLCVLALLAADVPRDDPVVQNAARFLAQNAARDDRGVYQTGLQTMALRSVDARRYLPQIRAGAAYLIRAQQQSGGWSYGLSGRTDNSNSQFALLGLHAAALTGVTVPPEVWQGARQYFLAGQNRDGGWGYQTRQNNSYGSMTAAGVASVYICDLWLHVARGRCGQYPDDRPLGAGLMWLARNFSVTRNPARDNWKFYYLYGLERAGSIMARRYFGSGQWRRDWYREGVEHLVGDPVNVVMAGGGSSSSLAKDCFILLFLAKGNAPLILQKAQWPGVWNAHRHDARFMVQFAGEHLGRPLDWQIAPLAQGVELDVLMGAPILYISGGGAAHWGPAETELLRQYVRAGRFVLVEAARGNAAFDRSFRQKIREVFPDEPLVKVPRDHPIYTSHFHLPVQERPPLEAVAGPCWLSLLYAPQGLSCEWDIARFDHPHFKLGANIIAYVTDVNRLEGKLVKPEYYVPSEKEREERAGAFVMGQIVHSGRWQPHKVAWPRILETVSEQAGLTVFSRPQPIDLEQESPFQGHMLYLTGVEELEMDAEAREKLRLYVERGGFIFAEAACGSERFDRGFRELMKEMFPARELQPMPAGHPLLESGDPVEPVNYTEAVLRENPGLQRPYLEFIGSEGRAVVVYSKYDLSSAVDGHPCRRCPAVLEPSAHKLAVKIILYALSS